MHICIMYMHYDQGTYMYMHRADMHHVYMHQGQGFSMHEKFASSYMHPMYTYMSLSRIIDVCIIHTLIRVKVQRSTIYASYMHVSGSRIMDKCIIHMCSMASFIRIKNICIRIKSRESQTHASTKGQGIFMHHTHMAQYQWSLIYVSYIHASGSRV